MGLDDRRRPAALNLRPARSNSSHSSNSSSSTSSLAKPIRSPRFVEATSIHSPTEASGMPFGSKTAQDTRQGPGDMGFGYINQQSEIDSGPKSPLKSALRVPGTPGRALNPMSPTFREEQILEKREEFTEKEQVKDVKSKTRVRIAKFALRGVNFSCSLIVLSMISSSLAIFNATKTLPAQNGLPAWASNTDTWPQKVVLGASCVTLAICVLVFIGYARGGHQRAEKVGVYYTLFAVAWFIVSMAMWAMAAGILQTSRNNGQNKDLWGWSCVQNQRSEVFSDKVDYALVCRLQNWSLICIILEVVVEVISITLYAIVFYRYYSKRRLMKSMNMRDRARSDLYLAQLRTQTAPNTPGFGPKSPSFSMYSQTGGMKSPAFSQHALSPRFPPPAAYRTLGDIEESSPFTPGGRLHEPASAFGASVVHNSNNGQTVKTASSSSSSPPQSTFKLQAPPMKAPPATPKSANSSSFTPTSTHAPPLPLPIPTVTVSDHAPIARGEQQYESVPIPGAYAGQALKSPPPGQTGFNLR